jgi:hypothetical protein
MVLYINYKDCQVFFHIFLFIKKCEKILLDSRLRGNGNTGWTPTHQQEENGDMFDIDISMEKLTIFIKL